MPARRSRKQESLPLPELLARVIEAIKRMPDDSDDRRAHGAALTELGKWACIRVLCDGVLLPASDRDYKFIQDVAMQHLGLQEARSEFADAVETIESHEKRDAVESASDHCQAISEAGYYYAGLACGLALAHFAHP